MRVSLIAALEENGGIGLRGKLPWHLSSDLRRFKALTMGHHIIMGRKTCESINRALPGRSMVVVTRQTQKAFPNCLAAHSLEQALDIARQNGEEEAFVIGGAQIFTLALPLAERLYLTRVHARLEADVFFPQLDLSQWEQIEYEYFPADEANQYPSTFQILQRRRVDSG